MPPRARFEPPHCRYADAMGICVRRDDDLGRFKRRLIDELATADQRIARTRPSASATAPFCTTAGEPGLLLIGPPHIERCSGVDVVLDGPARKADSVVQAQLLVD